MVDSRQFQVAVTSDLGLHLRVANQWVRLTRQFQSDVRVSWNGREVNGKSILDLLTLGAEHGAVLELEVTGPDSEQAASALLQLVAEDLSKSDEREYRQGA